MIFLCIHIANATKVTKYHFIPMKLKKKKEKKKEKSLKKSKIQNIKFLGQKWL